MAYDPKLGYDPQHWNGESRAPAGCRLLKHGELVKRKTPYYVYSPSVRDDSHGFKCIGNGWLHCVDGYVADFTVGFGDARSGPVAVRTAHIELHEDEGG